MVDHPSRLPCPEVLEPRLATTQPGMRISLVADIEVHNPGGSLCRSLLYRQPFVLNAKVDETVSRVAVLGALFTRSHLGYVLTVDDPRYVLVLPPVTASDLYKLKETCCGLRALGCGAQYVGSLPEKPTVNDLLPDFQQLFGNTGWEDYSLGDDEFRQFQQFAKSFEDLILDPATTAPTALHAWGNQTKSCLFGALVKEQTPDGPKFRHASAIEARESIAAVCNALFAMRDRVFNMTKTVPMVMFEESLTDLLGYPVGLPDSHFHATGAISGFRVNKRKSNASESSTVPGQISNPLETQLIAMSAEVPEPLPVEASSAMDSLHALKPFVRESAPAEFTQQMIGVVRVCENSVQAIPVRGVTTVAGFLRAESVITGFNGKLFDLLGCRLTDEAVLEPGRFYVYFAHDQFPEAMTSRIMWLAANGPKVAVDEMEFYLNTVSATFKMPWVPPMIIDDLGSASVVSTAWLSVVQGALDDSGVLSAFLADGHWSPVIVHKAPHGKIRFIVTQGGASLWPSLFDQQVRVGHFMHISSMPQEFPQDCGFQAFMWLTARSAESEFESADWSKAIQMRSNFLMALIGRSDQFLPRNWLLGGGSELQVALAGVLREHAIPENKVMERATMLLSHLGETKIQDMFKSKNPWRHLKQICNNHKPKLQIVLEAELQAALGDRARSVAPVGKKSDKRKKTKQVPELAASIHPNDILIPPGVFRQQNGGELSQLKINEISPSAAGVVVGHEEDLGPYIGKPGLSSQGLALLVLSPSKYMMEKFGEMIRFPVICVQTNEPMLVSALLLQKGAILVERNVPDQPLQIQEVSNVVIKVALFRDECPTSWEMIVAAPVKHLLEFFPQLVTCREPSCSCSRFHPQSRDDSDMIMDVWNRDFVSLKFRRVVPGSADVFMCCLQWNLFLRQSGTHGCYTEIRAPDGKCDDIHHFTVWLPRKSLREAQAEQAAIKEASAIIRIGHKYGLRVSAKDAESVHAAVRHEQAVMLGPNKQTWCMGPLPWGSSKQSVQKLIDEWGWKAKALHTTGKSPDGSGLLWNLHSAGSPPPTVYSLSHGDVLLTRVDLPPAVDTKPAPVLVASKRTRDSLSTAGQDPLQLHDPWAQSSKSVMPAEARYVTQAHLSAFAASLEAKVAAKVSDENEDVSMDIGVMNRVEQLELQVQQLTQAQAKQIADTQAISTQVSSLTTKVEATARSIESAIESKLTQHLQKLDNMLSKRFRGSAPAKSDRRGRASSHA
ncbi:RNase H domain-containing protein [Durusdinium trenchii]|uniref:RNase H domain-containing protein n=1 Tax=Durusdinium trenchii TaxID=1381693 RepID=A0ABP0JMS0_9DINO